MSLIQFFVAWGNAPFTIAVVVTVLFVALSLSGVLGFITGAHHDGDHDADADVDADAHADADADADADHADHAHDQDGADDDGGERGLGSLVLGGVGIGKLPLSLMWQSFSIVFGLTGLVLNARWVNVGPPPVSSLLWTVPVSTVSALAVMALLARILRPILSSKETEATKRSALVGQVGTVISSRVTTEFGEIRLNDRTGQVVRVVCKLEKGSRVPHEHEQVVVVACEDGVLYVAPLDADGPPSKPRVAEPLEDPPPEEAEERRRAAP